MHEMELFDLTNPQKSIWYTEEVFKGTTINNICTSGLIYEKIDLDLLKKAINLVVKQNDSFRIHVVLQDGNVKQYISDYKNFDIDIKYINSFAELKNAQQEEAKHVFNMIDSDLFKFKIVVLKDVFVCVVLTANHIISDSWSMGITIQEILRNYHELQNCKSADLGGVFKDSNNADFEDDSNSSSGNGFEVYSYANYINSEKAYKNSQKFENDKKFWKNIFETIPEQASIPGSLPKQFEQSKSIGNTYNATNIANSSNATNIANPSNSTNPANDISTSSLLNVEPSYAAERLSFGIDKELMSKINAFCKKNHFSVFSFFMALFSLYIGRVSNSDDFVIGTPILNRVNPKEKRTTGMFVNTAPVRVNLLNDETFSNFASSFSKKMMGILRHQKYSYNSILEDIRSNHKNVPNLYNILISYQVTKAFDSQFGNYKTDWTFNKSLANDMNIHIYDINDTGCVLISYDYLLSKYCLQDIKDLHARIVNMINQVLENNEILSCNIDIVTEAEKKKILYDFNDTFKDYPKNKTISELFEAQVEKTPDNVALVFEEKQMTYNELNKKANQLSWYLNSKNIYSGKVAILLDKNIDLVVSILAILKAGGCYIPISPDYPQDRINHILNDSNCRLLITSKDKKVSFKNTLFIDDIENPNESNLNLSVSPDSLAYIIYTSGSTGNPKGVSIAHSSLLNYICWANMFYCNNKPTNFPLYTSIGFDLTITSIFTPLLNGGTVFVYNDSDIFLTLKDIFENSKSDIVKLTPAHLSLLNDFDFSKTHVTKLIVGGDLLLPETCKRVIDKFPNIHIYNEYGPTEATVGCMIYEYSTKSNNYSSVPIGHPIANTEIYILDNNLKPVPIGSIGEIYISGAGLSKGYLNLDDKTRTSFVPNPYIPDSLMYKTGDIGLINSNLDIICLGRIDNQVKIRGFRIELGEIEQKLQELSFVNSCIVLKKSNSDFHDYLCAYFTATELVDPSILKNHLAKVLPRYMIPSVFIQMGSLPHNANGKIDRKKLPEPVFQNNNSKFVKPRNSIDEKLLTILNVLFKTTNISIEDDFFELGGDSLLAINFCTQIRSSLNVEILVKDILDNPVIKDLSDFIGKKNYLEGILSITPVQHADYYDVSSSQKSIYFSSQMAGKDSILYNTPGGIILEGNVDIQKIEDCFNILIKRHESLRTYFEIIDGNVVQKIIDDFKFKLDVVENKDFEDINGLFKKFVKPFDLSCAPLLRAQLIKFSVDKYSLFIDMHHIISDGISLSIITEEFCKLYNGKKLHDLSFTYKDFVYYQKQKLENGELKDAENYWISQFKDDIPVLEMPASYPRPAVQSFKGAKTYSKIDKDTYKRIMEVSKKFGVTPYMVLLSCYYILLYKYTAQDDIVIGSPFVGRDNKDLYKIIGMFVNTLPLRNKVDSSLSFKDFIFNIKEKLLQAYTYQLYPLDELINKLNIKRDTSRNPLFDSLFVYQNNGYKNLHFDNIKSEYFLPDTNISKFDLSVEAIPFDEGISLSFEYATSLFDENFIKSLSEHYLNILDIVLRDISIKISDICMLSDDEKNTILYDFNNTYCAFPKDKTIVDLFEEQAHKNPDKTAVLFENMSLTYKELNEKSNMLANYLKECGIKNKSTVPVVMNRNLDFIISIFAILKLGAIYLPVSPGTPVERFKYILNNSSSKYVLTNINLPKDIDCNVINIEKLDYSKYDNNNLNTDINPLDTLYIIYTSGSTGNPKGVKVCHKNLVNFIYSFVKLYKNISSSDRLLASTNIAFDVSIFEIFMPLLNGFELFLYDEPYIQDIYSYCNCIAKNKITFAYIPPNILDMVYSILSSYNNICLNKLLLGVEPIKSSVIKKYYSLNPDFTIINAYGPTETTICSTAILVDDNLLNKYPILPIGKPLNNLELYILDSDFQPVPIGIAGELYIAGDNVSNGYLKDNVRTKKSFINIPNINKFAYKTGDLAVWNDDGIISFIGRNDNQLKVNGYRIEIKEIEAYVLKYPNIEKVAVIKQTLNNREFLSCYYIAKNKIIINDLKNYLSLYLPKYMVPSYFIELKEFPYTANGKTDRKALPVPSELLNISQEQYVAPTTDLQKKLVAIFEKLLNTTHVGINDNFFDLGGDSLLAMTLQIELVALSKDITYQDIFRYPSVAELEKKIVLNDDALFFSKIQDLSDNFTHVLKNATKRRFIKKWHPKNVLLTGATGFLGIHILEQLIKKEDCKIYCIIRDSKNMTSRTKLYNKLNYYFGDKYNDLLDKKIIPITGDITKPGFGLNQEDLLHLADSVNVVINSAANVSHFGNYSDFYNTNVKSVRYILDFCSSFDKKLYHISTLSTSGMNLDVSYPSIKKRRNIVFDESCLYVGQILDNLYARTKFEAEVHVLNAISKGLDGYILRMGNLMPGYKNNKFQENYSDNEFFNKINSFIDIGVIPDYLLNYLLNFTPVDQAAKAVYKLLTHQNSYNRIFHLYDSNNVSAKRFIKILKKLDYNVEVVKEDSFKEIINSYMNNSKKKNIIKYIINDFDKNLHLNYNSDIKICSRFTLKYLRRCCFRWVKISNKYLLKFIKLLRRDN